MHSAPVPTNARYATESDRPPSMRDLSLCANSKHRHFV